MQAEGEEGTLLNSKDHHQKMCGTLHNLAGVSDGISLDKIILLYSVFLFVVASAKY